jgi:hypothetical protein
MGAALLLLWICMVASRLLCGSAAAAIPIAIEFNYNMYYS